MERFFFVTTYDQISAEILASLINIHPDIDCRINSSEGLLPTGIYSSLDKYVEKNTSAEKSFSGCVGGGTASYELYNRSIIERTKTPFKKVNIMLSPISRIRLLMYSWIKTGIPLDKLSEQVYNEFKNKIKDEDSSLSRYQVKIIYTNFVSSITKTIQDFQKMATVDPYYIQTMQKINNLTTPTGSLFLLALAMIYAYDMADLPVSSKQFSFEKIISNEEEFVKLIDYLTHNKAKWDEGHRKIYNQKLIEINNKISNILSYPWEDWQELIVANFINLRLDFFYGTHVGKPLINMYEEGGYSFAQKKENHYSKLISIQLNSCRPVQLLAYFDNIEETADRQDEIEVLVNIDQGDKVMKEFLQKETQERKFTIKYIESPRSKSYHDLWKPLNELIKRTDSNAYFLLNVSDEMVFLTKGWDTILRKYVGHFADDIFRLRLSRNKYRNYFDRWECNFAQDSCPITTKKWLDIGGDWNPCFGPDSFQQLVAFYLAKSGQFTSKNYLRDIPIHEIKLGGDIPEVGIKEEKKWNHLKNSIKAMLKCQSYKIQTEAYRRAMLIKAHIYVTDNYLSHSTIKDNKKDKCIEIIINNKIVMRMTYSLSWWKITLTNQWRKLYLGYYFCEIVPDTKSVINNILLYLGTQWRWCYHFNKGVLTIRNKLIKLIKNLFINLPFSIIKIFLSPIKTFKAIGLKKS